MLNLRKVNKIVNSGRKNAGYVLLFAETVIDSRFKLGEEIVNDQTVEEDGSITIRLTPYQPPDNGKAKLAKNQRARAAAHA